MSLFFVLALLANGRRIVVAYRMFNGAEGFLSLCSGGWCFYNRIPVKVKFLRFYTLKMISRKVLFSEMWHRVVS